MKVFILLVLSIVNISYAQDKKQPITSSDVKEKLLPIGIITMPASAGASALVENTVRKFETRPRSIPASSLYGVKYISLNDVENLVSKLKYNQKIELEYMKNEMVSSVPRDHRIYEQKRYFTIDGSSSKEQINKQLAYLRKNSHYISGGKLINGASTLPLKASILTLHTGVVVSLFTMLAAVSETATSFIADYLNNESDNSDRRLTKKEVEIKSQRVPATNGGIVK